MILGVLLVLLLTFGCVFAVKRAAHKKGADASGSAHKTEQTGSTGAYENVELVTEGEKLKELEAQGIVECPGWVSAKQRAELFEQSSWIQNVLGEDFCQEYIKEKKNEWLRYVTQVTDWEVEEYLYRL